MNMQRQPLLAEEHASLEEPRAVEAGPVPARPRSGSRRTASLTPLHPLAPCGPEPSPPWSSGSDVSWTDGGSWATASPSHLLPRPLARWARKRRGIRVFLEAYLLFCASGLVAWGSFLLIGGSLNRASPSSLAVECNSRSATGVERLFLVNLDVAPDLSFTQAKMLDLAWDTVIGQGLRFLHAWTLYHVISRCLTAVMELKAVPHGVYLDLQFSTVSLHSICSAASLVLSRKPVRTLRFGLWLLFEIAYVLSFATIWSAATGYISASVATFAVGEVSHVSVPSPELTYCWVIDDDRISPPNTTKIITGPQVASLPINELGPLKDYWSHGILNPPKESSPNGGTDQFNDVYGYFLTKSLVKSMLSMGSLNNETLDLEDFNELPGAVVSSSVFINHDGAVVRTDTHLLQHTTKQSRIGAWQLEDASHIPREQRIVFGNSTLNSTTAIAARKATFLLSDAAERDSPWNVPYNSTIRIDGEEIHLQAPFLATAPACSEWLRPSWLHDSACLCTAGVPVHAAIDTDNPTGCLGDAGYSWGFAGGMLGVALALEWLWLGLTWALWRWAPRRSALVAAGRAGAGRLRNILDAAEAVTAHLGPQHSAYTERELAERLRSAPPFGYVLETRRGVRHIGVRPVPTPGEGRRRRAQVEKGALYG